MNSHYNSYILFFFISFLNGSLAYSQNSISTIAPSPIKVSVYSESVYDARFDGGVSETRLRLAPRLKLNWIEPYVGVAFSQDLSNGRAPLLIENMASPTAGLRLRPLSFLYVFAEARHLFRFNNELRSDSENELRYGTFGYDFRNLPYNFFNETYGEVVVVDRVDTKPVTVVWNKLGRRFRPYSWLRPDVYIEGFTRISPNLGYGPDENELRLGTRVTLLKGFWAVSMIANYSPLSDVQRNGVDAMLVISREEY